MGALILSGSARSNGNTALTIAELVARLSAPSTLINLSDPPIPPFSYGAAGPDGAFGAAVGAMLAHDPIVFATPVYWYAMSGATKALFDRLTDLLGRPEGRALAGRTMLLLANGTDPALPAGFETPFRRTARYFGMDYGGGAYVRFDRDGVTATGAEETIAGFAKLIEP